jgi:hypothetical protein
MNIEVLWQSLQGALGQQLPTILGALLILVIGWLFAVVLRAALRRLLGKLELNRRVALEGGGHMDIEALVASLVYWLMLLVTLAAVFNALDLQTVSTPFAQTVSQVMEYLPHGVAGIVVAVVAWVLATIARTVIGKALARTTLDERLSASAGMQPMSTHAAQFVFWLVILLFLPAILDAFKLEGLLNPMQHMIDRLLAIVPNLVAALAIGFAGWVVAKVVAGLVASLVGTTGLDKQASAAGITEGPGLSKLLGTIAFVLIFIPSLIAAIDTLGIDALSAPATSMLQKLFDAVPDLFAAAVILVLTWYVGRFAASLVTRVLAGFGADHLPTRIGVGGLFGTTPVSVIGGRMLLFFAMLFAIAEAANRLGFGQVRDLVTTFIGFGGDVLLGAIILVIGYWLADVAAGAIGRIGHDQALLWARIARFAILGLVLGMGLRAMGIADDIVSLAFGLTLGAIAVAFALAFGLGGRDAAGRLADHWVSKLRKDE